MQTLFSTSKMRVVLAHVADFSNASDNATIEVMYFHAANRWKMASS